MSQRSPAGVACVGVGIRSLHRVLRNIPGRAKAVGSGSCVEKADCVLTPPEQITDRSGMKVHRPASPDFVSRQEAATRLNLSERQIDRMMTAGIFQKVKTSANRSGIRRVDFDAYLEARTATAPTAVIDEVPANFYGLRILCKLADSEIKARQRLGCRYIIGAG